MKTDVFDNLDVRLAPLPLPVDRFAGVALAAHDAPPWWELSVPAAVWDTPEPTGRHVRWSLWAYFAHVARDADVMITVANGMVVLRGGGGAP